MESRRYFVVSFKLSLEASKYEAATASLIGIFELKINQNETHPFHSILEKAIYREVLIYRDIFLTFSLVFLTESHCLVGFVQAVH